jgi:filamentous hemagglutinin family protein
MQLIRYLLVLLMTSSGSFAEELPKMSSISAGQVEVSQSLNELVVRQTSDSGIINWDSFNVSKGAGVIFEQPSAKSITLNNILSAAPSLIDGRVTAPGRVFFSSPSGIVFDENARVNVNTLLATNHSIERAGENEFDLKNPGLGQVLNLGALNAKSAYLIGRDVLNAGQITSSNGSIGLVAASDVRVSFDEAGLLTATILADDVLGTVTNTGMLNAGERGVNVPINDNLSFEFVAAKSLETNLSDQSGSPNYWVELSYNF